MFSNNEIAGAIRRKALELGFSACGFASVEELTELRPGFQEWVDSGRAGEMGYLERNMDLRLDPGKLVDGAKTVISLAASYYYPIPQHIPGNSRFSRYALSEDYHKVLKARGHELLNWINHEIVPVKGRVFTDSAPIFEREWAMRAGLGWLGKNGCLIIPKQGSYFFLTEIITDLDLSSCLPSSRLLSSSSLPSSCGTCTRCIDACPTRALAGDGSLDPCKCISYLTIEHKGAIPDEFEGQWNDWVFGCDVCQDVCPYNRKPVQSTITEFAPRESILDISGDTIKNMDEAAFKQLFDGTPVERAGWLGILRNFAFLNREAE